MLRGLHNVPTGTLEAQRSPDQSCGRTQAGRQVKVKVKVRQAWVVPRRELQRGEITFQIALVVGNIRNHLLCGGERTCKDELGDSAVASSPAPLDKVVLTPASADHHLPFPDSHLGSGLPLRGLCHCYSSLS